jgi:hypothetical protein
MGFELQGDMTQGIVNYVAHHFGVTGEGVGVLHPRIDLQLAS